jgi:hypothetical protein
MVPAKMYPNYLQTNQPKLNPMNYIYRSTQWIAALLLIATVTSCQIEEISSDFQVPEEEIAYAEEDPEELINDVVNYRLGNWNMIMEETFEETPFYTYVHKQFGHSHSFRTVSSPSLRGNNSGRFELRKGDAKVTSTGKRAEVLFQQNPEKELWYSFGLFIPNSGFDKDRDNDILSQWTQRGKGSPSISLRAENDRFSFRYRDEKGNVESIDLGPISKNTWNQFVFHIIHSSGSDGLVKIWRNGNLVHQKRRNNMYSGPLPRWKIGIYKPTWADRSTDTNVRIVYFDNVRIGNNKSSFEEMRPSADNNKGWGPHVPEIESYTLINAFTNKVIRKISNNEVINIKSLGTNKISLRADFAESFSGSVYFNMTGRKAHTYVDNAAPYTLYGDGGVGNYFNNGGTPIGDYTLNSTTFAEHGRNGKKGPVKTFKFKLVDSDNAFNSSSSTSVRSISLIQANTNTIWGEITDGSSISASQIGTHKLSIRANMDNNFKGRVLFELSGRIRRTSMSRSSAPYVLNNYNNGNYTFGEGLPTGNYSLKLTPHSEDGRSVIGPSRTYNFSIK